MNPQQKLNIGGLSNNGALPRQQSNVMSGMQPRVSTNTGLIQNGKPITTMQSTPQTPQQTPMPAGWNTVGTSSSNGNIQGLLNQHTPTTPVKSITDTSGNKVDFHAPTSTPSPITPTDATLKSNAATNNANNYGTMNAPVGNTTGTQIGNVANAGQQTANESQRQQGVLQAGQTTPDEKAFEDQYVKATAGKQFGALAPYAESSMYAGKSPEELQGLITAPDLAGRASADTGLYNQLGSAYGNAALAGLSAAQTSAARNLQANTTAYSGAQTQAGRNLTANQGVLGAVAPQFGIQYGTQVGQPALPNGGIDSSNLSGAGRVSDVRSIQDFTSQINTTNKSVNTLNNLANQIIPNMGTTGFNPNLTPIGNQTFAQYFANSDPASNAGIRAGLGEIKNQISNVISSATGLTPTAVSGVTDSYDFQDLNPQQLNDFLLYINQYAQSNIAGAQKSIQDISNGNQPTANPESLPISTSKTSGAIAKTATGATLASGLIDKIFSQAGNAVAGAVGGATSGLATKVLGL